MHAKYSERYFKTKLLAWLALSHYILFEERRGCRPNPFFDPSFFKRHSGTSRLLDYLEEQPLWRYPASTYFDSRWYVEKYSAELATNENPLRRFWRIGFDEGYLTEGNWDAPLNVAELERRQATFYEATWLRKAAERSGDVRGARPNER